MKISSDVQALLVERMILIDTCVLIALDEEISKHGRFKRADEFIDLFRQCGSVLAVNDLIKVEYLRGAKNRKELLRKRALLKRTCQLTAPPIPYTVYKDAMLLSMLYAQKRIAKSVDLADMLMSAYLRSHNEKPVFMTLNHKDFPLIVHRRLEVIPLELADQNKSGPLATVGLYEIDDDAWDMAMQELLE